MSELSSRDFQFEWNKYLQGQNTEFATKGKVKRKFNFEEKFMTDVQDIFVILRTVFEVH